MHLFTHKDFYLCAFLLVQNQKLVHTQRSQGYTEFSFWDSAELRKAVNQYYAMEAKVDPLKYSQSIRALKTVIHSLKETVSELSISTEVLNNEFVNKQSISA